MKGLAKEGPTDRPGEISMRRSFILVCPALFSMQLEACSCLGELPFEKSSELGAPCLMGLLNHQEGLR